MSLTMGILLGVFVIGNLLGLAAGTGAATLLYKSQPFARSAPESSVRAAGTSLSSQADAAAEPAHQAVSAAVESCRFANVRQQAVLTTAAVSLAQWGRHIDAMNQLVAGQITLSAARKFWEATRIGATEHAAAFRVADADLAAQRASCVLLDKAQSAVASPQQFAALVTCQNALAARSTVLARARTAVSLWEHHIHMMEMLRDGEVTPAQAAAAWLTMWKTGDRQLRSYRAAVAAAGPGCPLH